MTIDVYDRTCHECFERIDPELPMVTSKATGRRWHVLCAPPVEDDEQPRRNPRRMVRPGGEPDRRRRSELTTGGSREGWQARRDARLAASVRTEVLVRD